MVSANALCPKHFVGQALRKGHRHCQRRRLNLPQRVDWCSGSISTRCRDHYDESHLSTYLVPTVFALAHPKSNPFEGASLDVRKVDIKAVAATTPAKNAKDGRVAEMGKPGNREII